MDDRVGTPGHSVDVLPIGRDDHVSDSVKVGSIYQVDLVGQGARDRVAVPVDDRSGQQGRGVDVLPIGRDVHSPDKIQVGSINQVDLVAQHACPLYDPVRKLGRRFVFHDSLNDFFGCKSSSVLETGGASRRPVTRDGAGRTNETMVFGKLFLHSCILLALCGVDICKGCTNDI